MTNKKYNLFAVNVIQNVNLLLLRIRSVNFKKSGQVIIFFMFGNNSFK
jgi:hypothetical protein